jgi:hypothetical protein
VVGWKLHGGRGSGDFLARAEPGPAGDGGLGDLNSTR